VTVGTCVTRTVENVETDGLDVRHPGIWQTRTLVVSRPFQKKGPGTRRYFACESVGGVSFSNSGVI
jgi:hypothetical protein